MSATTEVLVLGDDSFILTAFLACYNDEHDFKNYCGCDSTIGKLRKFFTTS